MSVSELSVQSVLAGLHDQVEPRVLFPADCPPVAQFRALFSHAPIPFVVQDSSAVKQSGGYEPYIHSKQAIPTRECNWHDYYNALCWHLFPLTKQALHASQIAYQAQDSANNRSPEQNGATLFDENGVVIISTDEWVFDCLRNHEWTEIWWTKRERFLASARFAVIGHAIWEKCREPYIGMTAKWFGVRVDAQQLQLPTDELLAHVDDCLAAEMPMTPKDLQPLPLLGWPGICSANAEASFYDNDQYFRPARRQ